MKRTLLTLALCTALAAPAAARHGALSSNDRDAWIDASLSRLAQAGFLPASASDTSSLSNLEAAELTARAAGRLMAQAELPPDLLGFELPPALPDAAPAPAGQAATSVKPAATKDMQKLVDEFRAEISKMDVDVTAVERKLAAMDGRLTGFEARKEKAWKGSAAEVHIFGRGWMTTQRGFGTEADHAPLSRLATNFIEMQLTSIPVPTILFDLRLRTWTTFGAYYEETIAPKVEVRKINLCSLNDYVNVEVGDLYRHLTPLTLWNDDPWANHLKPTYWKTYFDEAEELTQNDQAPSWHMRGMSLFSKREWADSKHVSSASFDAFGGRIRAALPRFGNYYAGGKATVAALKDQVGVTGSALTLWDDRDSAAVGYMPDFVLTWAQRYTVSSVRPFLNAKLHEQVRVEGSCEMAGSHYEDDQANADRVYEDQAMLGQGSAEAYGVKVSAKYMDVGQYFYSPGAQTLRRTADPAADGYLNTNEERDFLMGGMRNRNVFQDVGSPAYAPYFRNLDNIFPYGDATPNRKGIVGGLSVKAGSEGWIQPQVYYTKAEEKGLNVVRVAGATPEEDMDLPLEISIDGSTGATITVTPREFKEMEGVLQLDVAKALKKKKEKLVVSLSYRAQETDISTVDYETKAGIDSYKLESKDLMVNFDFILPVKWMRWADMSLLWGQLIAQGQEFYPASGTPSYPFYGNSALAGSYSLGETGWHATYWAWNVKFALNKNALLRGEVCRESQHIDGITTDNRFMSWKVGYEVHI